MEMDVDDIVIDEDEWYYDSIKRYKKLSMFEMQNAVHQVEVTDFKTICTVNKWSGDQYEISELSIPDKLVGTPKEDGRVNKENDLKLRCGRFVNNPVSQIKIVRCERRLVSSETQVPGVTVYVLSSDGSDEIKKGAVLECGLLNPRIALNNRIAVAATDTCCSPLLIDLDSGQVKHKFPVQVCQKQEALQPAFVSPNVISLCNTSTGMVTVHDARTTSPGKHINPSLSSDSGNVWSHTTLFESTTAQAEGTVIDDTTLALISDCGSIIIYDTRQLGSNLLHSKLQLDNRLINTDTRGMHVRFKSNDARTVSVSGLDSNVYVFNVAGDQAKEVFIHDGHKFTENGYKEATTSSHVWFSQTELDNFLISSSYNKTIQFWQFNIA